jgi:hypothetical protein
VRIERPADREQSFRLSRLPGAAATVAHRLGGFPIERALLASHVTIDGVVIAGPREGGFCVRVAVSGRDVVSVHTDRGKGGAASFGMYLGGEVIMAQALLAQMGAASVRSVIVAHSRDDAIEAALAGYADFARCSSRNCAAPESTSCMLR